MRACVCECACGCVFVRACARMCLLIFLVLFCWSCIPLNNLNRQRACVDISHLNMVPFTKLQRALSTFITALLILSLSLKIEKLQTPANMLAYQLLDI